MNLNYPAKPETYQALKEGLPSSTTPNEVQKQKAGIKVKTLLKGDDCELHVRSYPGASGRFEPDALVVMGPTDSDIQLLANGSIALLTGKKTKERGGGSGQLNIKANGGLQEYNFPTTITYNSAGSTEPSYAIGIKSYGNYEEETLGERKIVATKLYISAEDIYIVAGSHIHIQAGKQVASGSIKLTAGRFEQNFVNEDKILFGQKTQTGAGEDTSIAFDPRATTTLTSAGTLQHRITGDYKIVVAGVMATSIAGASPTGLTGVPLITDRTHGYSLDVLIGKTRILSRVGSIDISSLGLGKDDKFDPKSLLDLPVGSVNISGLKVGIASTVGGVSISAGEKLTATIPSGLIMASKDVLTATATGLWTAFTPGIMNITSTGAMTVKSTANLTLKGALIYLN